MEETRIHMEDRRWGWILMKWVMKTLTEPGGSGSHSVVSTGVGSTEI